MKYCSQCNRQFTEVWLSFCPDDGTPLVHELTPPRDPNWDPHIRPSRNTIGTGNTVATPRAAHARRLGRARRTTADESGCVAATATAL